MGSACFRRSSSVVRVCEDVTMSLTDTVRCRQRNTHHSSHVTQVTRHTSHATRQMRHLAGSLHPRVTRKPRRLQNKTKSGAQKPGTRPPRARRAIISCGCARTSNLGNGEHGLDRRRTLGCSAVCGACRLEAPDVCCLTLRGVCLGVPVSDVLQLVVPSRTLARDDTRTEVDRLGLLGTVSRRGVPVTKPSHQTQDLGA